MTESLNAWYTWSEVIFALQLSGDVHFRSILDFFAVLKIYDFIGSVIRVKKTSNDFYCNFFRFRKSFSLFDLFTSLGIFLSSLWSYAPICVSYLDNSGLVFSFCVFDFCSEFSFWSSTTSYKQFNLISTSIFLRWKMAKIFALPNHYLDETDM